MAGSAWTNQVQNQVIIGGANGRLLVYSGTPAAGNLVESIAATTGTDGFGNNYLAGDTVYLNSALPSGIAVNLAAGGTAGLFVYTGINPGATFTQVAVFEAAHYTSLGTYGFQLGQVLTIASSSTSLSQITNNTIGLLNYQALGSLAADTNTYTIGQSVANVPSTVTINSAVTPVPIVSTNVAATRYRVSIKIIYAGGTTAASAGISWFGTSTVSNTLGVLRRARNSTNADNVVAINQNSAPGSFSLAFNANELETYEFEGQVTFSVAGTFGIQGLEGTAGDTWVVATNSYLELIPA